MNILSWIKIAIMDTRETSVFILMILFHLTNVISGASLGNSNLFNETLDDAEEEYRTVLQNMQKNYYADEFRNYKMTDIEKFFTDFMTPAKKDKKPIHTSKTFFGSDQFSGPHERSRHNSQHQTWDPFKANRFIESQPSYFDAPDDLFQEYIHSKNNHETSYSKTGDENSSDFPQVTEKLSEDKSLFSEFNFADLKDELSDTIDGGDRTEDKVDELSKSTVSGESAEDEMDELSETTDGGESAEDEVNELSKSTDDGDASKDQVDELSKSLDGGDSSEDQIDKLSTNEDSELDTKDVHMNNVAKQKMLNRLPDTTGEGVNGKPDGLADSTEDRDLFFQPFVGDASENREDELISDEEDEDSTFTRLNKVNTTNAKDHVENPGNGDVLRVSKIPDEHLEKVQKTADSDLMEFVEERNFHKAPITEVPDLRKIDIDEFEGSGDMEDSLSEALTETKLDNKSGRIIDIFPRVSNAPECITPKGERGRCRSLTQCPLSEPLNNFNSFLKYVCILRGALVGICCPDNPVVEISDPTENSTGTSVTEFKQPINGCGVNSNTRIVGGKISVPHEWTWMVALLRRNRFFCGGVIINDWYILTAAHCMMGVKVRDLKVRLGEHNFAKKKEHEEDIPVAEIKRHALFVTLTFQHDIALLKLKRRIEYSNFIGSICLPNPKSGNYSNVNATVVGWGTVAFGGEASPILRQVTVPVWDNEECDKTYKLERITNAFMCAGSPENGEDACQGDSGGPLMALNAEDRWEVIGIVSWGRRCGDPTFPGVYTRVTSYLDWIAENAN